MSRAAAAPSCRTGVAERSSTTEQGEGAAALTRAPTAATSASVLSADSRHAGRKQRIHPDAWLAGSHVEAATPGGRAGFFQIGLRRRNKECTDCMAGDFPCVCGASKPGVNRMVPGHLLPQSQRCACEQRQRSSVKTMLVSRAVHTGLARRIQTAARLCVLAHRSTCTAAVA